MSAASSAVVTDALELTEVTPHTRYRAITSPVPWAKAYGGDLIAQSCVAALRSTPGMMIHSHHSYFMRPSEVGEAIDYTVETLRSGRRFTTVEVRAVQQEKTRHVALINLTTEWSSPVDEPLSMPPVPHPDDLATSDAWLIDTPPVNWARGAVSFWRSGRGFDMRHVVDPIYVLPDPSRSPRQAVWIRPFDALRDVPGLSPAQRDATALAWVSDFQILEPALRMSGESWASAGHSMASLDHSIWFHRMLTGADLDGWVLYVQEAVETTCADRALTRGSLYSADGRLMASVAQEGIIGRPTADGEA